VQFKTNTYGIKIYSMWR